MPKRIAIELAAIALVVTACVEGAASPAASSGVADASASPPTVAGTSLVRCVDVPTISASPELYRNDPIYVANEQPVDEVRAWAQTQPGFEELWLDREHRGWITLAFSQDAEARQADVAERFPDDGVVVVAVDWTTAELEALQQQVTTALSQRQLAFATGTSPTQGVVFVSVGVLTPDRLTTLDELFAGERLCVDGIDPADAPPPGPQPQAGDGWRLLADEIDTGEPYRTGIASDEASYEALWRTAGLGGARPPVDFATEVVVWFGAVYGSSCPDLRLDDVMVNGERAIVHAKIVLVDPPPACTDDARPHAYVVAVERSKLPAGPFAIQLDAQDPPAGVPGERTIVEVDLSVPGAVAGPGQVRGDPSLPDDVIESGEYIEPGFPVPFRLYAHCGVEWLGVVNDVAWRTEVPDQPDFVPPEWRPLVKDDQSLEVSILLLTEPEPLIEATAGGHALTYRPSTDAPPGCD